ncbi:MAG: transposase family protein [Deltaproteobacteria bacterium]|jgi:hypothetical protein|nr:transposase family protein [Deltaproteobacteria bacterium]
MDPVTLKIMKPELNPLFLKFEKIYRIEFPLYIRDMVFDDENKLIDIQIDYHKKATFRCSCGLADQKVHSRIDRAWRALDIANYQARLSLSVPRLKCQNCGVKTFQVPWAREHSHLTHMMEEMIYALSKIIPLPTVAKLVVEKEQRILRVINHFRNLENKSSLPLPEKML